ncbi:hypothetical protein IscW_ISCW019061 [Ixodes scapularis]|uniref:Uncharacterized protein n=1 Tax=Ixodes scapularis TaxID=6945 RepID=B7PKL6_IXOSC|nr:hypothetical protein IscW_ISCW019061 [Ixodes scapularis]|eukprot:XP_002400827.1 hypothetical protein IscW_ISCW019061 [Ixodes scapularis]
MTRRATKDGTAHSVAKYDGKREAEAAAQNHLRGDLSLVLKTKARHHLIATNLDKPYVFEHKPFVLQDENGGLSHFDDTSTYIITFGPGQYGTNHKMHEIYRHRCPRDGSCKRHWKKYGGIFKFD